MIDFIEKLKENRFASLADPLPVKDIIYMQTDLLANGLPAVPTSFLDILHEANGISYMNADIFGIFPQEDYIKDIVAENLRLDADENILVLGASEMDFLVYKPQKKVYQILDRDDLEVLEEYEEKNVLKAVKAFLKIYD